MLKYIYANPFNQTDFRKKIVDKRFQTDNNNRIIILALRFQTKDKNGHTKNRYVRYRWTKNKLTDKPIKVTVNKKKIKNSNTHAHCHIHYKDHILQILNCKSLHNKYLITCTALLNKKTIVDFYWGEQHFYRLQEDPISLQSMMDFEKFIRQLREKKFINISDFKTPFLIVSEDFTEVFS